MALYKIGITKKTLVHRYRAQQFETLLVRETTRLFAWRAEQAILLKFEKYRQNGDIGMAPPNVLALIFPN